jgi:hypothetical protein
MWEDNIKKNLRTIEWDVDQNDMTPDNDRQRAFMD